MLLSAALALEAVACEESGAWQWGGAVVLLERPSSLLSRGGCGRGDRTYIYPTRGAL